MTKICRNVTYSYTKTQPNTNTTPLVSLDNSSTLTISDLFVAHSCFHPIDPKNGLKLFFCCVCCITFVHSSHYFLFKLSRVLVPVPTKIFQLVAGYFLEKRKLPVQNKALLFVASIFLVIFLFPCDTL